MQYIREDNEGSVKSRSEPRLPLVKPAHFHHYKITLIIVSVLNLLCEIYLNRDESLIMYFSVIQSPSRRTNVPNTMLLESLTRCYIIDF